MEARRDHRRAARFFLTMAKSFDPSSRAQIRSPGNQQRSPGTRAENEEETAPTVVPAGNVTSIIRGNLRGGGKLSDESDDEYRARRRMKFAPKNAQISKIREAENRGRNGPLGGSKDDESNFGRNAEANGGADGTQAAIHIEMRHRR